MENEKEKKRCEFNLNKKKNGSGFDYIMRKEK